MKYRITHRPTGESVIYEDKGDYDYKWAWGDGNYSCDCNRYLFFERAKGNNPELDDCPPCGDTIYKAEYLTDDNVWVEFESI